MIDEDAGSAIACGFLECLAERNALVVTTTHYDPVNSTTAP